jgi:YHS domain-containing protein
MKKLITAVVILISSIGAYAQSSQVFKTEEGAIRGYDPVAYFKEAKPVKGLKEHTVEWNGASWYFSSKENKEEFESNPEQYAPQYGGYCAYGTADGHKAPTQPDAWSIVDNKLYLNYNKKVQGDWKKKQAEYIRKADENWPTVKNSN